MIVYPFQTRGRKAPPLENQLRSAVRPYIAKVHFETYDNYDHMQNLRGAFENEMSQKVKKVHYYLDPLPSPPQTLFGKNLKIGKV